MENEGTTFKARLLVNRIMIEENVSQYLVDLAEKKPAVFEHCCNVAYLAAQVGIEHGYSDTEDIVRGALLHDMGKILITDDILLKKGKLDAEEWSLIQKHPEFGEIVLRDGGFSSEVIDIVMYHHEKRDGSGYPKGLLSSDIPRGAKVVTVCDIYEAMTAKRTYGREYNMYEAMSMMAGMPVSQTAVHHLKSCPDT